MGSLEGKEETFEIKLEAPFRKSWQAMGNLAMDQLKQGHTDYAIAVIPLMVEKLVLLERYTDEDGNIFLRDN